ncbi:MAG TPA: transcription antitermination factor NusB [Actinomycetes bacterium]|nr:transcription antitermination factor NusB [Actinomycetes bacterium]
MSGSGAPGSRGAGRAQDAAGGRRGAARGQGGTPRGAGAPRDGDQRRRRAGGAQGRGRRDADQGSAARQAGGRRGGGRRPGGVRDLALQALRRVDDGAWANLVLPGLLAKSGLDVADRAKLTDVVYGTVRMRGALDHLLSSRSRQRLARLEPLVLRGLRLGAFELLVTRTPAHAAVDEVVAAVRRAGSPGHAGYVNAVLRRLADEPGVWDDPAAWPDPAADPLGWATTRGSHPRWIALEALRRLGAEGMIALVEADNQPPAVTLRATAGRATVPELLAELAGEGIDARATRLSPECLTVDGGDPHGFACVRDGRAAVQDEGSALVAPALRAGPDGLVVDLAAGPGGKSGHLAALGARVIALELHPARAALVAGTAERLGVAGRLRVVVADATRPLLLPGRADAALVDAPCSNLGTLRRRAEARWRHQPEEVGELTRLQDRLLDAAALAVGPGGTVLYSVCTWTLAETEEAVARVRQRLPQLAPAPLGGVFGQATSAQLWPHVHGTDGIFLARFVRRR